MTYSAKVITGGKVVIPAELRRMLGIRDGDSLVFEQEADGRIVLKSYAQVVREVQAEFRAMVGGQYLVDDFIADRRSDWGEE